MVRKVVGEDRKNYHLVSANKRLAQLSVETELSDGVAK